MKLTAFVVAAAAVTMFAPSAHARAHYYHHSHHVARHRIYASSHSGRSTRSAAGWTSGESAYSGRSYRSSYRGRDRGRPAAWCGWEMRRLVGSDPGPSYNLARNWAHWGRPGPVGVGAVSSGRIMSARSSAMKTASGSSNPATTVVRCAPARARSRARLPSAGAKSAIKQSRKKAARKPWAARFQILSHSNATGRNGFL